MWEKRLYDAHPAASTKAHARSGGLARLKAPLALESDKHFAKIEPESWQNLQNAVRRNDLVGLQDIWNEIWDTIQMDQQQKTKRTEVTSEMRNNATMVRHLVKFTLTLKRGTVLGVQYGAESMNGFLQPVVKMVNLTHEKDLCIEHRNDQVRETLNNQVLYLCLCNFLSILFPIFIQISARIMWLNGLQAKLFLHVCCNLRVMANLTIIFPIRINIRLLL